MKTAVKGQVSNFLLPQQGMNFQSKHNKTGCRRLLQHHMIALHITTSRIPQHPVGYYKRSKHIIFRWAKYTCGNFESLLFNQRFDSSASLTASCGAALTCLSFSLCFSRFFRLFSCLILFAWSCPIAGDCDGLPSCVCACVGLKVVLVHAGLCIPMNYSGFH